ncbi:MmcQ/YjbR family DNA-binding protein [Paeniglutamicibacter antarcticus]|uniref:MmcQ/YjbR family DNA-binding protein n=1 Tax=Arthrobacter terrae TaxID=2935737 RepID=A0A931CH17_9MICC|nr:MmcQ/YjbR family DNA-binding protein [Arthrobacter terrae]MBG0738213.1 MmcQ/YjbR family DNA-binding protein [Arthrobacter terrae]
MDRKQLRAVCLDLPGAVEEFPFGPETSVFKVRPAVSGNFRHTAKMFALSRLDADPLSISVKCEPELALSLRCVHPEITGAYHLNKTHWNGVCCDGELEEAMIKDMIEDSHDLVVATLARAQREALRLLRIIDTGATQ